MKTQNISFQGGLNIHRTVSPEVRQAIKKSPAMKRFGRMYNAEVSQIEMSSSAKNNAFCAGLFLDNVKPRNIFVSIFDIITGRQRRRYRGLTFNSRQDEAGLVEQLGKMKKNSFVKMIIEKF